MQVTVFGATGSVGKMVVAEAVSRGIHVVAFQRSPKAIISCPLVTVVQGDIYDKIAVGKAIKGSDAVISCLGSWGTPRKDILASAMQNIIPAMTTHGIRRIVSVTGADARAPDDSLSLLHRLTHATLTVIAKKVLLDGESHIRLLEKSSLDWTVIRSPIMVSSGDPLSYKLTPNRPLPWETIPRSAVAHALVDEIDDASSLHLAPYIIR